jgi:uncharacterized protein
MGLPMRFEFDWDPAKARANLAKHKVSFDEAMTVFDDPLALSRPDASAHGSVEERWITIGLSRGIRLVLVVHTHVEIGRDRIYVRIISARPPTKREKRQYEQTEDQ